MLQKIELLQSPKEYLYLFLLLLFILSLSLSWKYYTYKKLIEFDSITLDAVVTKAYTKTKTKPNGKQKNYQVLKIQTEDGYTLYTVSYKIHSDIYAKKIHVKLYDIPETLTFYEFLKGFFLKSKILTITKSNTVVPQLSQHLAQVHVDTNVTSIYQALYLAQPLPKQLQDKFSLLGISHLIAISGFHLSVLFTLLYFSLKYPYKFFQTRYFPYRNIKLDLFIIIFVVLSIYTLFINAPPSILRALVMLFIGFVLYDRGFKLFSMQTLFLTIMLTLAFFPCMVFNIGFWLSVAGVFYIFLYLRYFEKLPVYIQFFTLPVFVYFTMLPYSLYLFTNFSYLHPASIFLSILFTLFYPISIFLHLIGYGNILDNTLSSFLSLAIHSLHVPQIPTLFITFYILISLLALKFKIALLGTVLITFALFAYLLAVA